MPVRRRAATIAVLLLGAAGLAGAAAAGAANGVLPAAKVIAYKDSGRWDRSLAAQAKRARTYIAARVRATKRPSRLALVLDIDDTALSTYACQKPEFTPARLARCVLGAKLPAIRPTLGLYRFARAKGVTVVFITGRPAVIRKLTIANLKRAGYTGRYTLVLKPDSYKRATLVPFKSGARRALERGRLDVVANVGDQRSDLLGGYADRTYKLSNPMYFTP